MTRQQIVIQRSPMNRRQCLLDQKPKPSPSPSSSSTTTSASSSGCNRLAEVAGGTTAECAAVICCFPCTVLNILVLAVYKVPAGLCRKALKKKRRRRLLKNGLLIQNSSDGSDANNKSGHLISIDATELSLFTVKSLAADKEFVELENEMWEKFYATGFWRSLSQRVD